jgi:fucose 4-O-acetylase-like acetyltransferase
MAKTAIKKWDIFNTSFILQEKRFVWLDYDKGISIILVGLGHSYFVLADHGFDMSTYPAINYISTFLWGFRMPLFFIISGTLVSRSLAKRGLLTYLVNRSNNILYPLVIWGSLQIALSFANAKDINAAVKNFINLFIDPRQMGPLWYLNALFFIGIIYSVLKARLKLSPLAQLIVGTVLFAVAGYIQLNNINAGMLTDVLEFYFFFALGDVMAKLFFDEQYVKRFTSWAIFLPLFILFLVVQYLCALYNLNGGADGINFVQHKLPWLYMFEALIGCAMSISLSFLLQKHRWLSFLRVVGYHSLFIYVMQIIVMNFARIALTGVLKIEYIPAVFLSVWLIGIVVPMVIYNICLKINMWWLFTFKKPHQHYDFVQQAELQ